MRFAAWFILAASWIEATAGPASAQAQSACLAETVEAAVGEVVDSRSLKLGDGTVVRLAGIEPFGLLLDQPNPSEPALIQRLAALTSGAAPKIQMTSDEPDRYGRFPAMVSVGGALVQETLAREGLALAFASGGPLPCFDRILAAEAEARRERRGFWTDARLPNAFPDALAARIGRFAIVEGRVASVGNRRLRTYLNFGPLWSKDVTAEIAADDRELFGGEAALGALTGRKVRVRGFLEESGGPMLVLRSPMQLEVLDDTVGGQLP